MYVFYTSGRKLSAISIHYPAAKHTLTSHIIHYERRLFVPLSHTCKTKQNTGDPKMCGRQPFVSAPEFACRHRECSRRSRIVLHTKLHFRMFVYVRARCVQHRFRPKIIINNIIIQIGWPQSTVGPCHARPQPQSIHIHMRERAQFAPPIFMRQHNVARGPRSGAIYQVYREILAVHIHLKMS